MAQSRSGPAVMAKNIELTFSDSGRIQAKLFSDLMQRYIGDISFLEFPKGFVVNIYDSAMRIETTISGNYGKRDEQSRVMFAKGNVVVRNVQKRQQLNSDILFWDEKSRKIFTKTKVRITTDNMILYGDGLESDESFTDYTILNPHGQMTVEKDSI